MILRLNMYYVREEQGYSLIRKEWKEDKSKPRLIPVVKSMGHCLIKKMF